MDNEKDDLAQDTGAASTGSNFFSVLWQRKALLLFGVVVGLVVGTLWFLQKAPIYQSTAIMVVFKKKADMTPSGNSASGVNPQYVEDYISTQETLLKSEDIWERARAKLQNNTLNALPPNNDYNAYFHNGLKIVRNKDTNSGATNNVLSISFQSLSSEDSQKAVNAVIDAYRDYLKNAFGALTEETVTLINKGIEETKAELDTSKKDFKRISDQRKGADYVPLEQLKMRVAQREQKKMELESQINGLAYDHQLIVKMRAAGFSDADLLKLYKLSWLGGGDNLPPETPRTADEILFNLEVQKQELLQRVGKHHPDVLALERRTEMIREYIEKNNKRAVVAKEKPTVNPIDLYLTSITQKKDAHLAEMQSLQVKLNEDRPVIDTLRDIEYEELFVRENRDRLRKKLDNYTERKQQIDLTRDAPLFDAKVVTKANVGAQVSPVLLTTLALTGFLGLLLGGGLAYLAEVSDKSFRSIEEVRRRLGLTVIGQVPALTAYEPSVIEDHPLDPFLVVHHAPKSVQAEAYRGVRTSLYFSTRGKGHQVIQVTSPNPGDGKSTLTANLATSIAQSGKRILLIDADFRKPRVHKIFGLGNAEVGLASVIAGEADLDQAIYSCEVPGLSILPCGPRPANPADLLTSALFSEILDEIKKDYDFVLIDTPPVLAVSDPSVVAPRVDGVILTIRMTKNSRPMAEQAKERLSVIGANMLGVVVNGMDDLRPSYGYGYGYGYGYAYAYGDDADAPATNLNKSR